MYTHTHIHIHTSYTHARDLSSGLPVAARPAPVGRAPRGEPGKGSVYYIVLCYIMLHA